MALMAEQPHLDAGALDQKSHLDAPVEAHSIPEMNGTGLNSLDSVAPITNGDHAAQNHAHTTTETLKSADALMTDAAHPESLNPPSFAASSDLSNTTNPLVTASPPHTQTVPPAIEQPTSDMRDESVPVPPVDNNITKQEMREDEVMADASPATATSQVIKGEAGKDVDMGEAAEESVQATASAGAEQESLAMRPAEADASVPNAAVAELSLGADPTPVVRSVELAADSTAGQETEANQQQVAGQVRQRDEEDEGEPMAKRSKLSDEPSPHQPSQDFKMPDTPASATADTPAPLPLNGLSSAATEATAVTASAPPAPIEAKHYDDGPVTSAQKKFLLDAVRKTRKTKAAAAFLEAVDPVKLNIPTYPQYITNPMDLSTMEEKLKQDQYASANAVAADVDLIAQNTLTFNGPVHAVTVNGRNMLAYFRKLLQGLPRAGQAPEVKKKPPPPPPKPPVRRESRTVAKSPSTTKPEPQSYALDPNGMPQIRRDSSSMNDRPKREIHPPKNREMPYQVRPKKKKTIAEFKFCESVLQELSKKKYQHLNFPFLHPVDPVALNIPTYFKVVKKPTDLETIGKHLSAGEYNTAKDFYNEVKLMFANCFKFNPPEDSVHQIGKQFEGTFEQLWGEKDEWMANHVRSERETSEEEDDEEEEVVSEPENDNAMKRMLEIQQQIAALSQEAMKLSSGTVPTAARGKASSPKSSGKKSKPSKGAGVPKPKRANSTVVPPAPAKPLKVRKAKFKKLTLDQKRYVSEGISQLDAEHMMKAVQIIRNGVPALRNVQDDELELDIEEIPDPVVYDLYQFVRKLRPKDDQLDEDDDYEEDPYMAKSSKAGNRKKNKPMSAREQESKIAQVQKQMQRFNNGSGSEAQSPEAANQDDSSDDEQSESSEEE